MALKSYIMTTDFKAPYVTATGLAHNPSEIRLKKYRRGQIIKGELKHANNKPAFVLVDGVCVVPISAVKELVTKEIVAGVDGSTTTKEAIEKTIGLTKNNTNPKVRYVDAMIIGSVVGFGIAYLLERQGILESTEGRNYKLYGALGGAVLASYLVYRRKTQMRIKSASKE
jgi:hypothetical protein